MSTKLIENLIKLGKIDESLARVFIEKKIASKKYLDVDNKLNQRAVVLSEKTNLLKVKQEKYSTEQKTIRDEREKLVARRKEIYSFNDYRTQQAAQKEIEFASKQLDLREERLISVLEEIEILKKDYDNVLSDCKVLKQTLNKLQKDKNEIDIVFKKREEESLQEKDMILKDIPKNVLNEYNKARNRNAMEPVTHITENHLCGGCAMKLGAQIILQASKESEVVHCPGCDRILYLNKTQNSENENN